MLAGPSYNEDFWSQIVPIKENPFTQSSSLSSLQFGYFLYVSILVGILQTKSYLSTSPPKSSCIGNDTYERLMVTYRYRAARSLLNSGTNVLPTNGSLTSGFYRDGDSNFDSNMVIILAALLCALICALGLNSIVRCALRCTGRFDGDADEVGTRLASGGIKKEALSKIPVAVYESGLRIPATDCAICLGEFVEGEDVRIFPGCNHGFHVKCIDRWLVLQSSCPTCRQPLIEHSMSGGAERVRVQIN